MSRCVIIAASPDNDTEFISNTVCEKDYVICADGGYKTAISAGIVPNIVIGDFDSSVKPNGGDVITLPVEKDYTDTMSAVKVGIEKGYKDFLLLNVLGGRLDHTINNLCTLLFIEKLGGNGVIEDRKSIIKVLSKGNHHLNDMAGLTVSLFPFGSNDTIISYKGLKYPLENYKLVADEPIAVSNQVVQEDAFVMVSSGKALLVINKNLIN